MLSISRIGSAGAAAGYYTREDHAGGAPDMASDQNAVEVDPTDATVAYYTLEDEAAGSALEWKGDGAALLGLEGAVDENEFKAVLLGINPDAEGEEISKREVVLRRDASEKSSGEADLEPKDDADQANEKEEGEKKAWSELSLDERVDLAEASGERHAAGWDLTFSAPKSASIVALDADGDVRLVEAHRQAIDVAMAYAEKHFSVFRIRDGDGTRREEISGNLLMARTTHTTSRAEDPNLHDHVIVLNATRDENGTWRALESEHVFRNMKLVGAIYQAEFRNLALELGHDIRDGDTLNTFELAEVPAETILAHSRRAAQIDANRTDMQKAKGRPLNEAEQEAAVLKDRPAKSDKTTAELRAEWAATSAESGFDVAATSDAAKARVEGTDRSFHKGSTFGEIIERVREVLGGKARFDTAQGALDYGKEAAFYTTTVATRHDMLFRAMVANGNRLRLADYEDTGFFERNDFVRADRSVLKGVTTDEIVDRERAINRHIEGRQGRGRGYDASAVTDALRPERLAEAGVQVALTPDQYKAVHLTLTSRDGVVAVQGFAGTGKTTAYETLEATYRSMEAIAAGQERFAGKTPSIVMALGSEKDVESVRSIKGAAPTHSAVKELTEKRIEAKTLSAILSRYAYARDERPAMMPDLRKEYAGAWLLVDEASMLGNRQLEAVFRMQKDLKIDKVILSGDIRQIAALQAGAPFKMGIEHNAGMARADLTTIMRQEGNPTLKEAVRAFAEGKSAEGLRQLQPFIHEAGKGATDEALADRAFALWQKNRGEAKVVVDTNGMRGLMNDRIRASLQAEGVVSRDDYDQATYKDAGLSAHDKMASRFYQKGQVVHFFADVGRFKAGDTLSVESFRHRRNSLVGTDEAGKAQILDLAKHLQPGKELPVGVYWPTETAFASGDRVLFNKTDKARGIRTNDEFAIFGTDSETVTLKAAEDGRLLKVSKDDGQLRFMTHAYAITADKAQGKSYSSVVAVLKSTGMGDFVNHARAYIMASRARADFNLVTDSFSGLMRKVTEHDGINLIALDNLFTPTPPAGRGLDHGAPGGPAGREDPSKRYVGDGGMDMGDKVKSMDRPQPERSM